MKIIYYPIFAILLNLLVVTSVLAIGSGSGGSAPLPSCTQSTWTCTDWSSCSTTGIQTRNCEETFHCSTANTPEPAVSQSCTPPAAPPQPSIPQAAVPQKPACTESQWQCSPWSSRCDIYGQEHRSCHLVADCPISPTPSPITSQGCAHLQCGNKATLHDRIACRLDLAPEGAVQEFKIQYLPEECRALAASSDERSECIARYKSYAPCWNLPAGEGRFACARHVLKLGSSVADEATQCQRKVAPDRASCEQTLKEKVHYMIKFRFYDLEERAEDLARRGADLGAVADLETMIESKKQAFGIAETKDQFMQIILDVRSAWQSFINQVKDEIK